MLSNTRRTQVKVEIHLARRNLISGIQVRIGPTAAAHQRADIRIGQMAQIGIDRAGHVIDVVFGDIAINGPHVRLLHAVVDDVHRANPRNQAPHLIGCTGMIAPQLETVVLNDRVDISRVEIIRDRVDIALNEINRARQTGDTEDFDVRRRPPETPLVIRPSPQTCRTRRNRLHHFGATDRVPDLDRRRVHHRTLATELLTVSNRCCIIGIGCVQNRHAAHAIGHLNQGVANRFIIRETWRDQNTWRDLDDGAGGDQSLNPLILAGGRIDLADDVGLGFRRCGRGIDAHHHNRRTDLIKDRIERLRQSTGQAEFGCLGQIAQKQDRGVEGKEVGICVRRSADNPDHGRADGLNRTNSIVDLNQVNAVQKSF